MTVPHDVAPLLPARFKVALAAMFTVACAADDIDGASDAASGEPELVQTPVDAEAEVVDGSDMVDVVDGSDMVDVSDTASMDDVLVANDTLGDDVPLDAVDTTMSSPDSGGADSFVWIPDDDTVPLFDETTVKTLDLAFEPGALAGLLDCWKDPPSGVLSGDSKCWFPCTATVDGQTSLKSGCRPKGSPKKWDEQWKPQFIVRFDHYDDAGRFFGLRRLNLEASPDHAAPVRDQAGMWFMRQAGLPAPRAVLLRVRIDGEEYGPYQSIEPVDKEFLSDHYADADGDLYDDDLDLVTNEKTSDGVRLGIFLQTAEDQSDNAPAALSDLDTLGDIDAFIRHLAAEACLGTVDNFSDGAGNTYFYDLVPSPGIAPIPWDLDDIFSTWADPEEPIGTCKGPSEFADAPQGVCEVLYAVPETRAAIIATMKQYRDGVLPGLAERVTAACALARPIFELDPLTPFSLADFDDDCTAILNGIVARRARLDDVPELQ